MALCTKRINKTMRFWRFDFDSNEMVDTCIKESTILPPTRTPPAAKNKPNDVIQNKLKAGDGLLLASFDRMRDEGHVMAIGIVKGKYNETPDPIVTWKRIKFTLSPNPGGGVAQWKKEACFKFADSPAKRYRLESRFNKLFGDVRDVWVHLVIRVIGLITSEEQLFQTKLLEV